MSTNAGPGDDYFLRKIVDSISFNKLTAPPQAYLNKGILYELTDGKLYFNGVQIGGGGGGGGVVGPASSTVNSFALFDNTTGDLLKATSIKLTEPLTIKKADDTMLLSAKNNLSVSLGQFALQSETSGDNNTAIGDSALNQLDTGIYNTAVGSNSMYGTTSGGANVCVGTFAGYNINGNQNTLLGYYAGRNATTASDTVGVGRNCLDLLTTGSGNIAVGNYAGGAYTTESGNICIGANGVAGDAGVIRIGGTQTSAYISGIYNNTTFTGLRQMMMVDQTGKLHASTAPIIASTGSSIVNGLALWNNTLGSSLRSSTLQVTETASAVNIDSGSMRFRLNLLSDVTDKFVFSNSTQTNNQCIGVGFGTLSANTGLDNIAVGTYSLFSNTTGGSNVGVGRGSLSGVLTGSNNACLGNLAATASLGSNNTCVGGEAGTLLVNGGDNTLLGYRARCGLFTTSGRNRNVIIGSLSGTEMTGGNDNIIISNVGSVSDTSGVIRIGTQGTHTSTYIAGIYNNPSFTGARSPVFVDSVGKLHTGGASIYSQLNYFDPVGTNLVLNSGFRVSTIPAGVSLTTNDAISFVRIGNAVTYTAAETILVKVDVTISASVSTTSLLTFALKDDPLATILAESRQTFTTGDVNTITLSVVRSLSQSQFLSVYVEPAVTTTLTTFGFNMNIVTI